MKSPMGEQYSEYTPQLAHEAIESMLWEIERQKTHAREGWERADEMTKIAQRLMVLATKWCDVDHHDWDEIKRIGKRIP